MHMALEEGCLKAGQRYWACFALRQVASRLSADSIRQLLASDVQHSQRIEKGAILLVGSSHLLGFQGDGPCGIIYLTHMLQWFPVHRRLPLMGADLP